MTTDGYRHMTTSCPQLQAEILQTIATTANGGGGSHPNAGHRAHGGGGGGTVRVRDPHGVPEDGVNPRRVRPRLEQ